jgi:branched-chain amino acid transport system permease protein
MTLTPGLRNAFIVGDAAIEKYRLVAAGIGLVVLMLRTLLSDDPPKSPLLAVALVAVLVGLAGAPFLFEGAWAPNTAAKICVFIVLVASYDLLIGYTGIGSFAHTMFYGIGAYGLALAMANWGGTWFLLVAGIATALVAGVALAIVIGLFALRVRAIFFAMMTLAVASAFATLAAQLAGLTGGEDGLAFSLPPLSRPSARLAERPWGVPLTGRILTYYIVFTSSLVLFLFLLRVVNSPFGRALQAIRENDRRTESLGFRTVHYRVAANALTAATAVLTRALNALRLRYALSFTVMIDMLLMVVIGGTGALYGAVIGATLLAAAQNYLTACWKRPPPPPPTGRSSPASSIPTAGCSSSACCSYSSSTSSSRGWSAACAAAPGARRSWTRHRRDISSKSTLLFQ